MKKPILGIIFALILLFSFQPSFAYEVIYEKWDTRIANIPTVCVIEPDYQNSQILSETFANRITDETRISVAEWQVLLQNFERSRDKSMWEINQISIPLEDQKDFDYDKCHIFIKFLEKPESQDDWYKLLGKTVYEIGDTGRSDITIYYGSIKFCKTEDKDWVYFDPCYEDTPRLMQQIKSVIKHEFGHALGLGHYTSDNLDVSIGWARGTVSAPSIMAVFSHQNLNENIITPKDIVAVRSMYGQNGFLPDEDKPIVFDSFGSLSDEYVVPKGGFIMADVEGLINEEMYISGLQVEITVIDPNQEIDTREVRVSSDGFFNFQTVIDESIINGTYTVFAKYRGEKSEEVVVDIKYEGEAKKEKIAPWVKNSVKWWAEDKINELDFILGIQHLIRTGVLNPPSAEKQNVEDIEDDVVLGVKIPKYVKQTSLWWTEGKITDEEFINGIQYLIKKGILVI